jgi:hypothetical protein
MKIYIHQKDNWSDFIWRSEASLIQLSEARNLQLLFNNILCNTIAPPKQKTC